MIILFANMNASPLHDIAHAVRALALDPARPIPVAARPRPLALAPKDAAAFTGRYRGLYRGNASYKARVAYRHGRLLLSPSPIGTTDTGAERLVRVGAAAFVLARGPGYALRFGGPRTRRSSLALETAFDDGRRVHARFRRGD